MKLAKLIEILNNGDLPLLESRASAFELLADIDAEIARAHQDEAARVGQMNVRHFDGGGNELVKASTHRAFTEMVDRRFKALEDAVARTHANLLDEHNKRLDALEASEVELRGYAQCTPTMSVFNALAERVKALESAHSASVQNDDAEDDAYKAWRGEPWPDDVVKGGHGLQLEEAFRSGFRASRK